MTRDSSAIRGRDILRFSHELRLEIVQRQCGEQIRPVGRRKHRGIFSKRPAVRIHSLDHL